MLRVILIITIIVKYILYKYNIKKMKKPKRKTLVKNLDDIFSKYIRLKNADKNKNVQAFMPEFINKSREVTNP